MDTKHRSGTSVRVTTAHGTYEGRLTLDYRGDDVQIANRTAASGYWHFPAHAVLNVRKARQS